MKISLYAALDTAASVLGYLLLFLIAVALLTVLVLKIIRRFPAKPAFATETPSQLDTPYGRQHINLLCGLQSRWYPNWFFGLMLLSEPTDEPPRRARVLAKKSDAASAS